MKAYLLTTGTLFGLMALVHIWRVVAEWPHTSGDAGFLLAMAALVAVPGVLSWWAWRLLRNLAANRLNPDRKGIQ